MFTRGKTFANGFREGLTLFAAPCGAACPGTALMEEVFVRDSFFIETTACCREDDPYRKLSNRW